MQKGRFVTFRDNNFFCLNCLDITHVRERDKIK
jgi:hypothetical protein